MFTLIYFVVHRKVSKADCSVGPNFKCPTLNNDYILSLKFTERNRTHFMTLVAFLHLLFPFFFSSFYYIYTSTLGLLPNWFNFSLYYFCVAFICVFVYCIDINFSFKCPVLVIGCISVCIFRWH